MGRATRIVERLHLRADSESAVRRTLPVLEDAFRTATLPDAGGRLIFVRRMNLGRLPKAASAQSLSLLLESRFTASGWRLVHAGDAGPEGGQAVWFRHSLEAHELAALRVAEGGSVDAWFWPLAVPALAQATSPGDRLRAIAFSLASHEEAPAALPAWTASLVRAGHGERLIAALRPGDSTALLRAAGAAGSAARGRIDSARLATSNRALADKSKERPARSGPALRGGSAFTASDDRLEFIDRMLSRTIWHPVEGPASSFVDERINAKSSDVRSETPRRLAPRRHAHYRTGDSTIPSRVAHAPAPIDAVSASAVHRSSLSAAVARQTDSSVAGDARPNPTPMDAPSSPWAFPGAAPTAAGGLLFLVPALERLGFGEWCAKCDAAHLPAPDDLARQIFHVLLSRLRIAEDDPAWQLAAPADEMIGAPEDGGSPIPLPMPDLRIHRNATIPEIWLAACRRLLRRRAHIGMATVVVRPARLALTETHVDVFFGLNAADVRVRRAGLDIDPGWVPWLAKVVAFHYQDRPWT